VIKVRENIPNSLTLANLICGCLASVEALASHQVNAAWFILLAAAFDLLDGFAARLLRVNSDLGKELDSFSDMVSFGLAPALIMYSYLTKASHDEWLMYSFVLMPVCAAVRLARFNLEVEGKSSFRGLPSPANAMIICSIPILAANGWDVVVSITQSPAVLVAIIAALSLLMISKIPMLSLKFKNFGWRENKLRYLFIVASFVVTLLGMHAIPVVLTFYFLASVSQKFFDEKVQG